MKVLLTRLLVIAGLAFAAACAPVDADYDVIIRGGTVYDGLGNEPVVTDIGINGDRIAAIGPLTEATARINVDASNKVVAPGFINMLSWATESLIHDGRALSDIAQGVTLEVMGEGFSMGPLSESMKTDLVARQGDIKYDVNWTTLGEYLDYLEDKGISVNIASYVGATSLRIHEVGYDNRAATDTELENMRELVREAMREGALGVGSSLIYAPANFANTEELIGLVSAAAEFGGAYISHIRSEGNRLEEGVQELIKIASMTGAPAEIYHLKASGKENWHKLLNVFEMVETARSIGLDITADMYTYPAGATGLDAAMPLWVQEGGHDAWIERLRDPLVRARLIDEMNKPADDWENFLHAAGADGILLLEFKNEALKPLTGKTLAEVAFERGVSAAEAAIDLVIEDDSRVGAAYFLMSEDNVKRKIRRPWISFGSDAAAIAPEGDFLKSNPHPRAYGTFARVLGRYSRDEALLSMAEAIRRMTSLPAYNISIRDRGELTEGYFADIVVLNPRKISDNATFDEPHQLATGVEHVFVNGVHVLRNGDHTGAKPGRVVRGPGWVGWPENTASSAPEL